MAISKQLTPYLPAHRSIASPMPWLALALLLLSTIWGCSGEPSTRSQPPQADLDIVIDTDQGALEGKMDLDLSNGKPLILTLGQGFEISSAHAENAEIDKLSPRGVAIHPDSHAKAEIAWKGAPLTDNPQSRAHISQDSVLLNHSSGWYPRPAPRPFGYKLKVTLAEQLQVVAEGSRGEDTVSKGKRRTVFHHNQPAAGITMVAGRWQKNSQETEYGTLYTFFPDDMQQLSKRYLEHASDYFVTYSEWIAPPAHDSYSIVAAPLPVGLAFAGFTYIGEQVLKLPFIPTTSLPHEVLHNWWGRGVYTDRSNGNWSEALTHYMGDYYQATQRSATQAARMRGDWLREQAALPQSRDYPLSEFRSKRSIIDDIVGYQRGAFLFHTLHRQLGEEAFTAAVKDFYDDFRHRWAGWHDLRHSFSKAAKQHGYAAEKVNELFYWFLTATHTPELTLDEAQVHAVEDGYRVDIELHWPEQAFPATVPIVISNADSRHEHQVKILPGESKTASIKLADKPELVEIDPDHHVYRQLAQGEAVSTLRETQLAAQVDVIGAGGREWAKELLPAAQSMLTGSPQIAATGSSEDAALIILGKPEEVRQALQEIQACDFHHSPPLDAEVVAWSTTSGSGQPVLALAAPSPGAARAALQRLRHYGRHSYVGFNGHPQTGLYQSAEHHGLRQELETAK